MPKNDPKYLLETLFKEILPKQGLTFRKQQLNLSLTMLEALENNSIALCEAEVGTGKTHAYILAIVVKNLFATKPKSAVISTSTIALQKALTDEYLPQISAILQQENLISKELKFVVRKGKSHYICDKRLNAYVKSIAKNPQEAELIGKLERLKSQLYILDLDLQPFNNYVKARICLTRCEPKCGLKKICRYQEFLDKCKNDFYDFQIVNHNYFIADRLSRKVQHKALLANYGMMIIDEAHKIPDAIQSMYGKKLSLKAIPMVINKINDHTNNKIPLCMTILGKNEVLFETLAKKQADNGKIQINKLVESHIKSLENDLRKFCSDKTLLKIHKKQALKSMIFQLEKNANLLQTFAEPENHIIWLERDKNKNQNLNQNEEVSLVALAKNLNEELNKDLWQQDLPIIMTSGTISVKGDFAYLEKNAGLEQQRRRMVSISTTSPFDYESQALLYLPKKMPYPKLKNMDYVESVIKEILKLIEATHGHTLILFTSYKMMEQLFHIIENKGLKYPMFMMSKGSLGAIDEFRKSKNGVLFASDSAGEGVDLAGDILSSLIVVKLPFPIPSAIGEYEISLHESFEEYLNQEVIPTMIIKLRQWIGRGIRREDDSCVFSILDFRASARYYEDIVEALPKMPVTREVSEVAKFIENKKSPQYFSE